MGLLFGSALAAVLWVICGSQSIMAESAPSSLLRDDTVNLTICCLLLELGGKGTATGRISGQSIVHLKYYTDKCRHVLGKKKNGLLIDGDDIVHQTPENFAVLSECYHNKPNGKFKE